MKADFRILTRATEAYNKILAIDPNNAQPKSQINYIHEFDGSILRKELTRMK